MCWCQVESAAASIGEKLKFKEPVKSGVTGILPKVQASSISCNKPYSLD
jgi:hypothetical protein